MEPFPASAFQKPKLNNQEFEQAPGEAEGQGSLARCSPWAHRELDMTYDWTTTGARRPGAMCSWSSSSQYFPSQGAVHICKTTQEVCIKYCYLDTSERSWSRGCRRRPILGSSQRLLLSYRAVTSCEFQSPSILAGKLKQGQNATGTYKSQRRQTVSL